MRRHLREIVRLSAATALRGGSDYVLIGRGAALEMSFSRLAEDFAGALKRLDKARRRPPRNRARAIEKRGLRRPATRARHERPEKYHSGRSCCRRIVLIGWQYFIGMPQKQRQEALLRQQQAQQAQPPPAAPQRGPSAGGRRSPRARAAGPAPTCHRDPSREQKSRAAAHRRERAHSDRHAGDQGLDRADGARIDDISLVAISRDRRPEFAARSCCCRRRAAPHPFYAEFGWVGGRRRHVKLPGPDTVWRQEGTGALAPGHPVTLTYDNGDGLTFRRTIAVDDKYLFTIKRRGHK